MKTLPLSRTYPNMSRLSKEDEYLFRKLLKGGNKKDKRKKTIECLRIMPVTIGCEFTCCGFYIENYQLFRSKFDGKYYLVFYPIKYQRPPYTTKCHYFHYILIKAHHQDNYYYLMRHTLFETYRLGLGYTLIKRN